jgi:putative tryptophan/tyrosine transport system substrate-binding protein
MKRREFIRFVGGMPMAWPLVASAQQTVAQKRVALLMGGNEENQNYQTYLAAFRQGLADANWREGSNLRLYVYWGNSDATRINTFATALIDLAPDLILATNTPTARALKQATGTIPIVFAGLSDPIGDGIVASLSQPGGNITGFTSFNAPIAGKWLELLKEAAPTTERAAVIFNPKTSPYAIFLPALQAAAPQLHIALIQTPVSDPAAIEAAIGKLANEPHTGLVVLPDIFMSLHGGLTFSLSTRQKIPTIGPLRSFANAGSLMSYGSDFADLFRQSAQYVDRILRGERPRDLPVQDPTKYELVINLKTAKAIDLSIPPTMLARADEVIE